MSSETQLSESIVRWLDSSGHMFMEVDRDWKVVVASHLLKSRFGAEEGNTCYQSMFGRHEPCSGCPVKSVLEGAKNAQADLVRTDRQGRTSTLQLEATAVQDERGGIKGAAVVMMEAPSEQRTCLPREEDARLRTILDQLPDIVFSLDHLGRFTFVNPRAEEFLGFPREEILGRYIWDFAIPEDKPIVKSLVKIRPGGVWDRELDVRDSRGTKKHVRTRCVPRYDGRGTRVGFEGIMRDRTAQRKLEEDVKAYQDSLKASEQKYRSLVEEVPDIIFSLDASGSFTFVNSRIEGLLGYSVRQIMSTSFWEYVAPEYKMLAQSLLNVEPRSVWDEEMALIDAAEGRKWVRIRCRPSVDSRGRVTGFEGVLRDRTSRKKLEEDLMASKQEIMDKIKIIDDLYEHIVQSEKSKAIALHTAEVAHELRQPLAIIGGFARRMFRQLESCSRLDPQRQRECFGVIVREVERLEKILTGLIEFTRQDGVHLEKLDPTDLIENVFHLYEDRLREKDLDLEIAFGDEVTEVYLDRSRFEHVICNLVANAIDASPERGVIRIETGAFVPSSKAQETGRLQYNIYFEMKVSNEGRTIPPEELQRIFDPFYTTKEYGSGIGLNLCKKIVEDHHGSISVKSSENMTTFCVWIPMQHLDVNAETQPREAEVSGQ